MDKNSEKYRSDDPGFDKTHGLLKNRLDITEQKELDYLEGQELLSAYEKLAIEFSEIHSFAVDDIRYIHKTFLEKVYEWAGEYRNIDIISEDIRWCHAVHIDSEMNRFGDLLTDLTPFSPNLKRAELLDRLAKIHGELVVIHPFRDGNGRVTRLLCDLLLMQAEIKPIGEKQMYDEYVREEYFVAIKNVWAKKDYAQLIQLFDQILVK